MATGTAAKPYRPHRWVGAVRVAPDGSWLASAGHDGEIRIWNPTTRRTTHGTARRERFVPPPPASTTIAAAGELGPYFLALCHGVRPR